MKLYSYWRSSASWRVRIALALKGVAYEYVPVHLVRNGGEQRTDAYRARNPMAQVPTLAWDEAGQTRHLSQSVAICEYLDALHPSPRLVPADPYRAAEVRERVEIVNAGIQPLQNTGTTRRISELAPGASMDAWNHASIETGLRALEAKVAASAGRHAVGDEITLADVFLVPQLYNARRFHVDLAPFPTLVRVDAACAELPAFRAAHAHAQPDTPPEEKQS
ncbi:MAG: maleylacetoacetate isomerase [Polyangiales bacterium]|nr:maleylacetoacetate isomerase [Myxococcales bacterium]